MSDSLLQELADALGLLAAHTYRNTQATDPDRAEILRGQMLNNPALAHVARIIETHALSDDTDGAGAPKGSAEILAFVAPQANDPDASDRE